jgi:plastocyanin
MSSAITDWLVNIVQTASGDAELVLDGGRPGQPIEGTQGDTVTWSNKTNDQHLMWQTDENYNPLGQSGLPGLIKPGLSSDSYDVAQPIWGASSWTVYYYCSLHPENNLERGVIQATALPIAININDGSPGWSLSSNSMTQVGTPLSVTPGQTLYWFNKASSAHQPWAADANFNLLPQSNLSGVLQPNTTSAIYTANPPSSNFTPATGWTINYGCKLHPTNQNEQGQIVVPSQGG